MKHQLSVPRGKKYFFSTRNLALPEEKSKSSQISDEAVPRFLVHETAFQGEEVILLQET